MGSDFLMPLSYPTYCPCHQAVCGHSLNSHISNPFFSIITQISPDDRGFLWGLRGGGNAGGARWCLSGHTAWRTGEAASLPKTMTGPRLDALTVLGGNDPAEGCGRASPGGLRHKHASPARAYLSSFSRCVDLTPTHMRLTPH